MTAEVSGVVKNTQAKTGRLQYKRQPRFRNKAIWSLDFVVLNYSHTCSHWIKEEEKFPYGCADIEGIERLLKAVKLGEGRYQL